MAERSYPPWWWYLLILAAIGLIVMMIKGFVGQVLRANDADRMEKRELHTKCRDARVLFFESCAATGYARWQCETQWAQLRDLVWDSPPHLPWADTIDCSEKKSE